MRTLKSCLVLTRKPRCTVMKSSAGLLALVNISFSNADTDLISKDIQIRPSEFCHLNVDMKTLLEKLRDLLDRSNFYYVNYGCGNDS